MHATFKPHHFLDFLCDMGANNGNFEYISPLGHDMRKYGNLLSEGKIDTITFTFGADDPCKPCIKLKDGRCTDTYTPELTKKFGFDNKYDYNLSLDTGFSKLLPQIFSFDKERNIDEIYSYLKENLTPEIILKNWPRDNRVELTFKGLELAIKARERRKL